MKRILFAAFMILTCNGVFAQSFALPLELVNLSTSCVVSISMKAKINMGADCSQSVPILLGPSSTISFPNYGAFTGMGYSFGGSLPLTAVITWQVAEFQLTNCSTPCTPVNGSVGDGTWCSGIPGTWGNGCQSAGNTSSPGLTQYTWQ